MLKMLTVLAELFSPRYAPPYASPGPLGHVIASLCTQLITWVVSSPRYVRYVVTRVEASGPSLLFF